MCIRKMANKRYPIRLDVSDGGNRHRTMRIIAPNDDRIRRRPLFGPGQGAYCALAKSGSIHEAHRTRSPQPGAQAEDQEDAEKAGEAGEEAVAAP